MAEINNFPAGWDEEGIQDLIQHYETQSDEEAITENEAAFEQDGQTVLLIPTGLGAGCAGPLVPVWEF